MNKQFLPVLLVSLAVGCSSSPSVDDSERFTHMSGGQSVGDSSSFYWYTEQFDFPYSASDFVSSGDYGWYQTDYRWRDNVVREIVREGEQQLESQKRIPYRVHLRFNKDGEAVYQQYRLDGKVLPMTPEQITLVKNEATSLQRVTRNQYETGEQLVQGYWDGETFTTCAGDEYEDFEFNQTLPSFVVNRLSTLDSYAGFVGSTPATKLVVNTLLLLEDEDFDCIERPVLIEE